MEPYAPIPGAGPFVASADLFTALVAELEGPGTDGLTACELEDLLAERGREVQRQLLQDHLDLRAAREEQAVREHPASATGADGITRTADRFGLAWGGSRVQGLDVTGGTGVGMPRV